MRLDSRAGITCATSRGLQTRSMGCVEPYKLKMPIKRGGLCMAATITESDGYSVTPTRNRRDLRASSRLPGALPATMQQPPPPP